MALSGAALAWENPADGGALVSTGTSVNNTSTGTPFTLAAGGTYAVACSAEACIRAGSGSSTTAVCTYGDPNFGVHVSQDALYDVVLTTVGVKADTISMIPVSGSATCSVMRVVVN